MDRSQPPLPLQQSPPSVQSPPAADRSQSRSSTLKRKESDVHAPALMQPGLVWHEANIGRTQTQMQAQQANGGGTNGGAGHSAAAAAPVAKKIKVAHDNAASAAGLAHAASTSTATAGQSHSESGSDQSSDGEDAPATGVHGATGAQPLHPRINSVRVAHDSCPAASSMDPPAEPHKRIRKRERSTVPFNHETWRVLGVWIARRCSPKILFWIAYWRRDGTRVKVDVGVDSVMKVLAPKKKKPIKLEDEEGMATTIRAPPPPTRCLFLHVRVVQRVDAAGNGFGELRYICTDLGVSYRLGNTGHYWKQDHPDMFQLSCPNWNSSLNRSELEKHLSHGGGGKVFKSDAALPTRTFIRAVLEGKGILAQCTLAIPPALAQQAKASIGIPAMGAVHAGAGVAVPGASVATPSLAVVAAALPPVSTGGAEVEIPFSASIDALLEHAMQTAVPFAFHPPPNAATTAPATSGSAAAASAAAAAAAGSLSAPSPGDSLLAFANVSTAAASGGAVPAPSAPLSDSHSDDAASTSAAGQSSTPSKPRRRASDKYKPVIVPDAVLPFLQFSTVPSSTMPLIVIPKPTIDETVAPVKSLGGSKPNRAKPLNDGQAAAAVAAAAAVSASMSVPFTAANLPAPVPVLSPAQLLDPLQHLAALASPSPSPPALPVPALSAAISTAGPATRPLAPMHTGPAALSPAPATKPLRRPARPPDPAASGSLSAYGTAPAPAVPSRPTQMAAVVPVEQARVMDGMSLMSEIAALRQQQQLQQQQQQALAALAAAAPLRAAVTAPAPSPAAASAPTLPPPAAAAAASASPSVPWSPHGHHLQAYLDGVQRSEAAAPEAGAALPVPDHEPQGPLSAHAGLLALAQGRGDRPLASASASPPSDSNAVFSGVSPPPPVMAIALAQPTLAQLQAQSALWIAQHVPVVSTQRAPRARAPQQHHAHTEQRATLRQLEMQARLRPDLNAIYVRAIQNAHAEPADPAAAASAAASDGQQRAETKMQEDSPEQQEASSSSAAMSMDMAQAADPSLAEAPSQPVVSRLDADSVQQLLSSVDDATLRGWVQQLQLTPEEHAAWVRTRKERQYITDSYARLDLATANANE